MLYTDFKVGAKELKLRLNCRSCVALEKKLGKNPISVFSGVAEGNLPTLTDVITILHAALQALEHGYTEEKTFDLFDEYIEEGHTLLDIIPVILDVFTVSGLISGAQEPEAEGKNA